mgnify:CR=1 FL=1
MDTSNFDSFVKPDNPNGQRWMVLFYTYSCEECKALGLLWDQLSVHLPMFVGKIDTAQNERLAARLGVTLAIRHDRQPAS